VTIKTRIKWRQYGQQSCNGMPLVCRHMVVASGETPIETLSADEAISFDAQQVAAGIRLIVESNNPNTRVLGVVFDVSTQRVVSQVIMANTEGD
jgi:hypothetical protein